MPVSFRNPSITIPSGTGRRAIPGSATFGSRVIGAGVGLNGFMLDFDVDGDRHINVLEVDVDFVSIIGNTVNFVVECQYADVNFDDPYKGYVTVFVVAEVA